MWAPAFGRPCRVFSVGREPTKAQGFVFSAARDTRVHSRLCTSIFADAVGLLAVPAGRYKGARFLDHPVEDPEPVARRIAQGAKE